MFSNEPRCIYARNPLMEVICQLRFPEILKIEAQEPYEFQDAVRAQYPQYVKKVEQLPPVQQNGKLVPQGTVNNYQFITADGQWKVSLAKGFIALSTHRYTRWEEFAARLDVILADFIRLYQPAYFSRVGLRYINFIDRAALDLEDCAWRALLQPEFLGLMADEATQEGAFQKHELTATLTVPGGARANIKSAPAVLRRTEKASGKTQDARVFLLDLDLYLEGNTPLGHAVPALNVVHGNAGSLFRGAITDTLHEAMQPQEV